MRIVHISDLHFGHHDASLAAGLAAEIEGQSPDLVVVSGDFTQRGTAAEFAQARAFLDLIARPVFAVPGNHDVPVANIVRRLLTPYSLYQRYVAEDLEPFVEMDGVAIAGLKTARQFTGRLPSARRTGGRKWIARGAAVEAEPDPALGR